MRLVITRRIMAGTALLAIAGCGGATADTGGAGATTAGSNATIASATIGSHGVSLVAGSNQMTLYQFSMDVAGSGTSACTGGCASTWPPLTVTSGTTPTAASGITGMLGTITLPDGTIQVTYNGKPLHFYSGDTKAGDANGNYPEWSSVPATDSGAAAAPGATPTGSPRYGY
jgi:predicted lipoprotein with Yx(FWY)xxD motif